MHLGTIYFLVSYLLIYCLPLFGLFIGKPNDALIPIFSFGAVSLLSLWAVFKHPRWFHYLLLPVFLAIPIEIYLRIYFNQGISTHHIGIIAETSPKEALEFLGNRIWLLLGLGVLMIAWWWSLLKVARTTPYFAWKHGSRWLVISLLISACGFYAYAYEYGVAKAAPKSISTSTAASIKDASANPWTIHSFQELQTLFKQPPQLPSWTSVLFDEDKFGQSWPLGVYSYGIDYFFERRYLSRLAEKSKDFQFHAKSSLAPNDVQMIVLVIGESSRYDRWSLNGYERETNPLLKQEKQLVLFSDMITPVSATRLSVPIISTRKDAQQSLKPGFFEKSFISAFKEAGFKTVWLSNQMSFGQFDTPTSVIAKEADEVRFLNLGGFTNSSSFDDVLLDPLQKALSDPAKKKLIVLHSLGNHWNYSHRHPAEFDQWRPSLFGVNKPAYTDLKNKTALSNSYDNSILYTDWFLSQVITQLKQTQELSALMYVSDHGQTLYDGTCKYAFHGHNTKYEFQIPAFVWYSTLFKDQFPTKVSALNSNKDARLSTENVFHSLLDMADIHYPDEQLDRSVFSMKWKAHVRYVDSYGWSNYDDSTLKGDCKEIIDNKTPLTQEK